MEQKESGQKRRKYDASFKEEVLKMVLNGRPIPEVAQSLDIGENLIYKYTKEQQPTAVSKVGNITSPPAWQDQSELLHKPFGNWRENGISTSGGSASHFQPTDLKQMCHFIQSLAGEQAVETMCRLLAVSRSDYYQW